MSYRFSYDKHGVYGSVVRLVSEHAVGRGLHLDVGCGWGAIAEPISTDGFTYVGFDIDPEAVSDLRARGFEAHLVDLQDADATRQVLLEATAGRAVSAITTMDTLEHITTGLETLRTLREIAAAGEPVPLIVSVPNVSHSDIAAKLLTGRWDYTETGLLDHTHIRFFTDQGLAELMGQAGWVHVGSQDFPLPISDQHFPDTSIALSRQSALGGLLQAVREGARYGASVNQFVRAYLPGNVKPGPLYHDRSEPSGWPLTVMVRTQGRRPHTLRDALLCLLAQTSHDFEVILLAHDVTVAEQIEVEQAVVELPDALRRRTRVLAVHGGGRARPLNEGVKAAKGRYIAVLDDDDTVFAHWVETFIELARSRPGRLCRAVAVSQPIASATWSDGRPGFHTEGAVQPEFPREFDLFSHIARNRTPFMCWAFPHALFSELGLRFDETLSVCEDWDVVLRGAFMCGVVASEQTVANYRRWQDGDASHLRHDREDWASDAERIVGRLNQQATVLAPGAARRLRELIIREAHNEAVTEQRDELMRERDQLVQEFVDRGGELTETRLEVMRLRELVDAMAYSSSWRWTAPLRKCVRLARSLQAS